MARSARSPRRTTLHCSFSWLKRKVRGRQIMPRVTRQPVDGNCVPQVAVESFEARARIINAWLDLPFPTLSILHLIDQLRDALANASTLAEKKAVKEPTYAFHLLAANGVTTKEAYDKATEVEGRYTRDVEGEKHYKIVGYKYCPFEMNLEFGYCQGPKGVSYAIEEIAKNGPIYGGFVPYTSFFDYEYEIYRTPKNPGEDDLPQAPHALLLFGIGSQGRRTSIFAHQNNWGPLYHVYGRGIIECKTFLNAIVPIVEKNWED